MIAVSSWWADLEFDEYVELGIQRMERFLALYWEFERLYGSD